MSTVEKPKLRGDLEKREQSDEAFELTDPITKRAWTFDELQMDVLESFDGDSTLPEIAQELGGGSAKAAVDRLAERAHALGLLESSILGLSADELGRKQAATMKPLAKARRDRRVAASVRWARDHVDFFAETLGELADGVHGVEDLPTLPTTSKVDIRENFPDRLLRRGVDLASLVAEGKVKLSSTSGSTGGRLQYVFDLDRSIKQSFARHPGFAADPDDPTRSRPSAMFTTPICNGQLCHRGGLPFEERMLTDTVIQLNSSQRIMRLPQSHIEEILSDMERHGATYMTVDPVYAAALVLAFRKYEMPLPKIDFITTGFEYFTARHEAILKEAFGVPIYPSYGATDIGGGAAISCRNGRYHVLDDDFVFEYIRHGKPVAYGEIGEIYVTTLRHNYTRHIRYKVGDVARPIESCGCSFDDWQCFEIEGRVQDLISAVDGTIVTSRMIDELFRGLVWADFYQLIQKEDGEYQLLVVPADGVDTKTGEWEFMSRLLPVLGDNANVRIQYVRELPIEQSFKFPLTKRKASGLPAAWGTNP